MPSALQPTTLPVALSVLADDCKSSAISSMRGGHLMGTVSVHHGQNSSSQGVSMDRRFCKDCKYFSVEVVDPDPVLFVCESERTKTLPQPIGYLSGPNAPACPFFASGDRQIAAPPKVPDGAASNLIVVTNSA
ncbi:MAG: hypothetical protein SFV18_18325 [Bryobacteraceae bacterium]|nr:hypothetical protein [Bryobacteraceae bacterium]